MPSTRAKVLYSLPVFAQRMLAHEPARRCNTVNPILPASAPDIMSRHEIYLGVRTRNATTNNPAFRTNMKATAAAPAP